MKPRMVVMNQNTTIAFFSSDQIVNRMETSSRVNDLPKSESDSFENYFSQAINQTTPQTQSTENNPGQTSDQAEQVYSDHPINSVKSKESNTIDDKKESREKVKDDSTVIVEVPKDSIIIDDQGKVRINVDVLPDDVKEKLGIGDQESVEIKTVYLSKEQIAALLEGKESFDSITNSEDNKQKDFPVERLFFARYQKSDAEKDEDSQSSSKIVKDESKSDQSKESDNSNKTSGENSSNKIADAISNITGQSTKLVDNLVKSEETPLKEKLAENKKGENNILNSKDDNSAPKNSELKDSTPLNSVSSNSEFKGAVSKESAPNDSTPKEPLLKDTALNQSTPIASLSKDSDIKEKTTKDPVQQEPVLNNSVKQESAPSKDTVLKNTVQKDTVHKDSVHKDLVHKDSASKDPELKDAENSISKYLKSPAVEVSDNNSKQSETINDNQIQSKEESQESEGQKIIDAEEFVKASNSDTTNIIENEAIIESVIAEKVVTDSKTNSEQPESSKVLYMVRSMDQGDDDDKQQKIVLLAHSITEEDKEVKSDSSESSKNNQQKQKGESNSDQESARLIESARISSMIKAKEERIAQYDSKESFKKAFTSQDNKTTSSSNNKSEAIILQSLRNNQQASILETVNQVKPTVQTQSNNQPDQTQIQSQQSAQTNFQSQPIIASTPQIQQTPQATMMQQYMEKIAEVQEAAAKQIVKGVQGTIGSDRSHVTLRMVPESLGQIHIRITMENGQLSAQLNAEKDSTRAMMQQGLNTLRSAFDEQGLKVDRLVVNKEQFDPKQDYGKNEDSQDRTAKNRSDYNNRQNQQENNRNGNQARNKFALWSDRMATSDYYF